MSQSESVRAHPTAREPKHQAPPPSRESERMSIPSRAKYGDRSESIYFPLVRGLPCPLRRGFARLSPTEPSYSSTNWMKESTTSCTRSLILPAALLVSPEPYDPVPA